jgi:hypothetical protein
LENLNDEVLYVFYEYNIFVDVLKIVERLVVSCSLMKERMRTSREEERTTAITEKRRRSFDWSEIRESIMWLTEAGEAPAWRMAAATSAKKLHFTVCFVLAADGVLPILIGCEWLQWSEKALVINERRVEESAKGASVIRHKGKEAARLTIPHLLVLWNGWERQTSTPNITFEWLLIKVPPSDLIDPWLLIFAENLRCWEQRLDHLPP